VEGLNANAADLQYDTLRRIRIQLRKDRIRIKGKSRIRINIKAKGRIRIRIKLNSQMPDPIRINVLQIFNSTFSPILASMFSNQISRPQEPGWHFSFP
jgi:hypothetical protein